ncbi:hypothetical protein BT96DRAFT_993025 [Gymnopus androsaceus JB14]|uniref:Mid2 domain-containing protein n=1 Tax=Gymnopus androsaceus JB14 TaxID=1447944 RepID=A0A6A4HPW3_9AGAR|nr:hypothetical protein BT96DRAFT_993025 [Gymnopus androsaceus JB14]
MFAQVSIVVAILSAASGLGFNTHTNVVSSSVSSIVSWTVTSEDSVSSQLNARQLTSTLGVRSGNTRLDSGSADSASDSDSASSSADLDSGNPGSVHSGDPDLESGDPGSNSGGLGLNTTTTTATPVTTTSSSTTTTSGPTTTTSSSTTNASSSTTTTSSSTTNASSSTTTTSSSTTATATFSPTLTSRLTTSARASFLPPGSSTQTSNQSRGASISSTTTSLAGSGSTTTSTTADAPSAKTALGAILSGVVGGVVALVLAGLCTFLSIRRRARSRQEDFEKGPFKDPEDAMRANPTSDGSVPLRQEVVTTEDTDIPSPQVERRANSPLPYETFFTPPTQNLSFDPAPNDGSVPLRQEVFTTEDADIPNPHVEQGANSLLPHGAFFSPPTPNPSFDPSVPSLDLENLHSPRNVEMLLSTCDMRDDTPDPGSPSTAHATWGGVASKADKIPSPKTDGPEPAHPIEAICRDKEQPLDISDSRRNTIASPLPLQALNQTQESLELYNNQGQDLTMEEEVSLLELQLQIARRRLAENRGSIYPQTPPPEYASTSS